MIGDIITDSNWCQQRDDLGQVVFLCYKNVQEDSDDAYLDDLDVNFDDLTLRLWEHNSVELMTQIQGCHILKRQKRNRSLLIH